MDPNIVVDFIDKFGVTVFMLLAVSFALYKLFIHYEAKIDKLLEEHKEEIQEMQDTYKTQMEKIVDGVAVKVDAILEIIKGDNNVSRTKPK